ncbi:peptide deformylase [Baaleninema sp.]|uniref:peptide deformylase n=1 Tax=Baaleninema sp. TaxID=3101197 RepID=UPI003CFE9B04
MEILELGHPVLREKARSIADVRQPHIQQLIDSMLVTVRDADGVGLAAPQIGESLRLLVIASRPNSRYPDAPMLEPTPMANPRVLRHSEERAFGWEGCLSVPGRRGWIPRYREVEVEYLDRSGNLQCRVLRDFVARIFQHEFDHLEGLVFLDRVQNPNDAIPESEYWKKVKPLGA